MNWSRASVARFHQPESADDDMILIYLVLIPKQPHNETSSWFVMTGKKYNLNKWSLLVTNFVSPCRSHPEIVLEETETTVTISRTAYELLQLKDRAMDSIKEGITIADCSQPDMPLIYANQGFVRITGTQVAEVLGKNCRFLQVNSYTFSNVYLSHHFHPIQIEWSLTRNQSDNVATLQLPASYLGCILKEFAWLM